jgi:hypothetical protein
MLSNDGSAMTSHYVNLMSMNEEYVYLIRYAALAVYLLVEKIR